MAEAENLLSEWAALLLTSLADAGVRDVVMSPGSRSTPFVAAAIRERRLRLHDVIDERAASFVALGQARVTGKPSVLLCTSGSAGAHYFPAIIEANASGLPLVVLTADRPLELMDCGAAQTIDQTKLFGEHVRKFVDLGAPDASPLSLRALRRMAVQAVTAAKHPIPGAVHINARARKPLEPTTEATSEAGRALAALAESIRSRPIAQVAIPRGRPEPKSLDGVAEVCARAERGLIVCGPAPTSFATARSAVFELARRTRFPILAELPSQLRLANPEPDVVLCDGFEAILRAPAFRRANVADVILQIGSAPTASSWELYAAAQSNTTLVVLSEHAWIDPASTASHVVFGDLRDVVPALVERLPPRKNGTSAWEQIFANAATRHAEAVDEVLASADGLTEGRTARTVIERLPEGSALMLGNSLPIRTTEAFGRRRDVDVSVFCQRGANGIDGLVAGSAGAARALERPFTLYIGDVSLLHDLTALMLLQGLAHPFVVLVVQNGGGRIFEQLPLGRGALDAAPSVRELYAATLSHVCTPHPVEFEHAAALFGHAYSRVQTDAELRAALDRAYGTRGCTIVEVIVPPSGAAAEYKRLWDAVAVKLGDG